MAAFSGDGSSPEPIEVFPEKIEHDIIDLSNSPAVSSSSSTILSSPPFKLLDNQRCNLLAVVLPVTSGR